MRIHQALHKKSSDQKAIAPTPNPLASRPFAVQPKPEEETRSHETKGVASTLADFSIFNPEGGRSMPVQPKLAIRQPAEYEQEGDHVAGQVVQRMNAPNVVQRVVAWNDLETTQEKDLYGVNPKDRNVLYGKKDAFDPEPSGLYSHGSDTEQNTSQKLKTWIPNVRFMQGAALEASSAPADFVRFFSRTLSDRTSEFMENRKAKDVFRDLKNLEEQVTQTMGRKIETGKAPTMGVVGKNDCLNWAVMLQKLIRQAQVKAETAKESTRNVEQNFDLDKEEPERHLQPGDTMQQKLGEGSGSAYHGATIVARDTQDLVTLEAHVEKNITAPKFHIRAGLKGFVNDNNEGERYREKNKRQGILAPVEGSEGLSEQHMIYLQHMENSLQDEISQGQVDLLTLTSLIKSFKLVFKKE